MIPREGLKPSIFHCQDDGAGRRCRGCEKKSDVRPAKLPTNTKFFPINAVLRDQFSSPDESRPAGETAFRCRRRAGLAEPPSGDRSLRTGGGEGQSHET